MLFRVGHLLSLIFRTLRRNLFLFTSIVLVLASGSWIRSEWKSIQRIVGELPSLQSADKNVSEYQAILIQRTTQQVRRLSGATVQQLDARIRIIDDQIIGLQQEKDRVSIFSSAVKGSDAVTERLAQSVKRKVHIELLHQEKGHLVTLRARVHGLANRQAAVENLEKIRVAHVSAYAALQRAEKRRAEIEVVSPIRARIFFTDAYKQVHALNKEVQVLQARNHALHRAFVAQQKHVYRLPSFNVPAAFQVNEKRLSDAVAPLRDRLVRAETLAAENYAWQAYLAVRPLLPVALWVLLGWWLVPAAIRTLFYFVLAPLAARLPPIVIARINRTGPASPSPGQRSGHKSSLISAQSQSVILAAGHEMLIRPAYCQSQPVGVNVSTRLLFNWHRWLTSIAAHLWMLKRLRATQAAAIVVSSTVDPLDEVALLEIGPGEAFVLQPRGLVGMIYEAGRRPVIRSHWRLGSLHAWLTFQLRYLAFEGPATLIVKGCRGVRLEPALGGRTISQDATLGFSADAVYATVRAEPFLPYLKGTQPLLHDKFAGHNAYYLYEEVPRSARPGGLHGQNPLEALINASLKAFGV